MYLQWNPPKDNQPKAQVPDGSRRPFKNDKSMKDEKEMKAN
jgi:hypothetical protein